MNADDPVLQSVAALALAHAVEWLEDDVIRALVKIDSVEKEFLFDTAVLAAMEAAGYVTLDAGDDPTSAGHIHVTEKGRYWAKRWAKKNKIVIY